MTTTSTTTEGPLVGPPSRSPEIAVVTVGGPTVVLDICGMRLVVDPTFDAPGRYEVAPGRFLTKTAGPALEAESLGRVDLVLLSHDQHADNLDDTGRAVLASAAEILTTPLAAERLGGRCVGMDVWSTRSLTRPDHGTLRITAVPAQHGPNGSEHLTGPVTGFVLDAADLPTVYISGDNASIDLVEQIAHRFPTIDLAIVFAGAARTALLGDANLTLSSAQTVDAARLMPTAQILPVHCDSWLHFSESGNDIIESFRRADLLDRLIRVHHGEGFTVRNERDEIDRPT